VRGIEESGRETDVLSSKQGCLLQSRRSRKQTQIPSIPRLLTWQKEIQHKTDVPQISEHNPARSDLTGAYRKSFRLVKEYFAESWISY